MFAGFKRPASTLSMQTGGQDTPISIAAFQKSVCEDWFTSPVVFAMKALNTPLLVPMHLKDGNFCVQTILSLRVAKQGFGTARSV